MNQIEKAMKEAHRFADKAIRDANQSNVMGSVKEWLKTPVIVTRGQFAVVLVVLSILVSLIG